MDKIRYTMKSESSGLLFTFCDRVEVFAREVRRLVEFNFVLVGVEGLDGYKCPIQNEFAHVEGAGDLT